MIKQTLLKKIRRKQNELIKLAQDNNSIVKGRVYKKSCELDELIVEYMKSNKQLEIVFD